MLQSLMWLKMLLESDGDEIPEKLLIKISLNTCRTGFIIFSDEGRNPDGRPTCREALDHF